MRPSFLVILALAGCYPFADPFDTGSISTTETGFGGDSADTGTPTGIETGDTGSPVIHGTPGDLTAVWFLADFGIDANGDLATVTAEGPIPPRLRAVFMNNSRQYDFTDLANPCVITFDLVSATNTAWITADPDLWFGMEFDPTGYTSNCGGWGDVYGAYIAPWADVWGLAVGGELEFTG